MSAMLIRVLNDEHYFWHCLTAWLREEDVRRVAMGNNRLYQFIRIGGSIHLLSERDCDDGYGKDHGHSLCGFH